MAKVGFKPTSSDVKALFVKNHTSLPSIGKKMV